MSKAELQALTDTVGQFLPPSDRDMVIKFVMALSWARANPRATLLLPAGHG